MTKSDGRGNSHDANAEFEPRVEPQGLLGSIRTSAQHRAAGGEPREKGAHRCRHCVDVNSDDE